MGNVVALNTFFQQQFGDPVKPDDDRKNEAQSIQSGSQKRPPGYNSWAQMKQRCDNPKSKSYVGYGGRGIEYDQEWKNFDRFIADMGPPPSKDHSLERIDPNGNYERANCKWASKTEQARNRCTTQRVVFDGKFYALAELAERYDISLSTLKARLRAGRSLADALHDPVERGGDRRCAHQRRRSEFDCWPSGGSLIIFYKKLDGEAEPEADEAARLGDFEVGVLAQEAFECDEGERLYMAALARIGFHAVHSRHYRLS